ncbi:unnamed protein product [Urochloa humidicola]
MSRKANHRPAVPTICGGSGEKANHRPENAVINVMGRPYPVPTALQARESGRMWIDSFVVSKNASKPPAIGGRPYKLRAHNASAS